MNTIRELFNGNIYPFEAMYCTKEAVASEKKLSDYLKAADEVIPKEDNKYFSDMIRDEISTIQNLASEQAFELGFSLGVRLTAECYTNKQ